MPQAVRDPGTGQQEVTGASALKQLTQTFVKSAMTDGGGTSGNQDFAVALPAGAVVLGWGANTSVAFTGDTTATIQVGISGGVGNFSQTTTGSCFTAIKVSSASPVATSMTAASTVPRITITSSTDFTLLAAGATVAVTVYFLDPQNP